jgi:Uma2 family endonuclease
MTTAAQQLVTADEFLRLHGDEKGIELVKGQIVRLPIPGFRHGKVCYKAALVIGQFVTERNLGHIVTNDTFIRTRTNPDGCRGADVIYVSYAILPADQPTPVGAITPPLELVVEVRSPSDSVVEVSNKANEYLTAGVKVVLVLDPELELAAVFRADEYPQRFHNGDELTLPEVLPGFAVPVKRFFE